MRAIDPPMMMRGMTGWTYRALGSVAEAAIIKRTKEMEANKLNRLTGRSVFLIKIPKRKKARTIDEVSAGRFLAKLYAL